ESADIISIASVDEAGGWLYYIASPDDPVRRYLYRTRLDGAGTAARLTPAGSPGVHGYSIAPGAQWAIHTHSRFNQPAASELIRPPASIPPLPPTTPRPPTSPAPAWMARAPPRDSRRPAHPECTGTASLPARSGRFTPTRDSISPPPASSSVCPLTGPCAIS